MKRAAKALKRVDKHPPWKRWRFRDPLTFNKIARRTQRRLSGRDYFYVHPALVRMIVRYALDLISERPMPRVYEFMAHYRRAPSPIKDRAWAVLRREMKRRYPQNTDDLLRMDVETRRVIAQAHPELSNEEIMALHELKQDAIRRRHHHAISALNKLISAAQARYFAVQSKQDHKI